jgi:hypothetical protein
MSHPLNYFRKIYVINLPSRPDRQQEMAEQLQKIGLTFTHPQVELFPALRPEARDGFRTIGARGCFMSHLEVLKDARRQGYERILICEDDLDFASDFNIRIPAVVAHLADRDWGFFYGGHRLDGWPLTAESGLAAIPAQQPIDTAHFVAFDQAAIAGLVVFLELLLSRSPGHPDGGPMDVDGAYTWYRSLHPAQATLAAVPVLGHQRRSRTDIHGLRWFDRTPVVRQGMAGLRRLRNRWNL